MKYIYICILIVLFMKYAVCAGEACKLDVVHVGSGQSVMVCLANEFVAPVNAEFLIPIENKIYPLGIFENKSDIVYMFGVDMSLFTEALFDLYWRNSESGVVRQSQFNIKTLETEFIELSTLAYQHPLIKQKKSTLKFVSLVKKLSSCEPDEWKYKQESSRIIFIVGSFEEIKKSFEIPYYSAFRFSGKYTLE